jgi:flavodoxin
MGKTRKDIIMRSCLVAYYSRTGITAQIGQEIAEMCGGDIEVIRDSKSRSGPLGFLRSLYESITGKQPALLDSTQDPGNFDTVILGTPVWAGRMSSPMRTYLHRHRDRFHRVALFCTMAGNGGDKALAEVAALCGKTPFAQVMLTEAEIQHGDYQGKLAALKGDQHAIH